MAKITVTPLSNLNNPTSAVSTINANESILAAAFDNTISRDGTAPNQMDASLDMNGNTIINVGTATTSDEAVSLGQLQSMVAQDAGYVASAATYAAAASASAVSAAASASTAGLISGNDLLVWPSRTTFSSTSVNSSIGAVRMLGYATTGDGGEATYIKLGSAPSPVLAGHVQSADGAWWALVSNSPVPAEAFGILSTNSDNTTLLQNVDAWCGHVRGLVLQFGAATYNFAGTITFTNGYLRLRGAKHLGTILSFTGTGTGDCLVFQGSGTGSQIYDCAVEEVCMTAATRTGGTAIRYLYVASSMIERIFFNHVYNAIEAYITNDLTIRDINGYTFGTVGIYWHGDGDGGAGGRCDVLNLFNVYLNGSFSGCDGLWWDGAAYTLNSHTLTFIHTRIGLWIKNSTNSVNNIPAFGIFRLFVTDAMITRSVQIDTGRQIWFNQSLLENTDTPGALSPPNGQGGADVEALLINADASYGITSDIKFTDCRIGNSAQSAVNCYARDVQFIGCHFVPGGKASPGTYTAVNLLTPAQDVEISNCIFSVWGEPQNWDYGIYVGPSTTRIRIRSNEGKNFIGGLLKWSNTDSQSYASGNFTAGTTVSTLQSPNGYGLNSQAVIGSFTLTTLQTLSGILVLSGTPGAGFTATTPTAAQLVAACAEAFYYRTDELVICNATNQTCTFTPGTGCDTFGNNSGGVFTIAAGITKTLHLVYKNTTIGSEYITFVG